MVKVADHFIFGAQYILGVVLYPHWDDVGLVQVAGEAGDCVKVLDVFCCMLQIAGCALHEESGVICESLCFCFVECVDNSCDVFAACDLDEEDFNHDDKEVWGDDVPLRDSLFQVDGVSEVTANKYL